MLDDAQIRELRSHFPILNERTYLYSCSQGAYSDAVAAGLNRFAQSWRTSSAPWNDWMEHYETLRASFARFINAEPDEVALVTSASAGIAALASALTFERRNKVVMSEYEFPTMGHIWLAQQPRGAKVEFLDGVANTLPTQSYERAIDRQTLIVPLTHLSFINGFRSDVAAVTRLAHDQGALLFLDGFQDCGTRPIDVKALDCDFYVSGTLKYLLGPPGVGFLYVRRSLIESLTPTVTSWMAQRDVFAFATKRLDPAPAARRFEGGSPSVPNIFMAQAGLDLLTSVGMDNVAAQIANLTRAFLAEVTRLGIATKTSASSVGPLVVLRSTDAPTLVARLTERNLVLSARLDGVRISFHVYNTLDDVAATIAALKDNLSLLVRT